MGQKAKSNHRGDSNELPIKFKKLFVVIQSDTGHFMNDNRQINKRNSNDNAMGIKDMPYEGRDIACI